MKNRSDSDKRFSNNMKMAFPPIFRFLYERIFVICLFPISNSMNKLRMLELQLNKSFATEDVWLLVSRDFNLEKVKFVANLWVMSFIDSVLFLNQLLSFLFKRLSTVMEQNSGLHNVG